MNNRLNLKLYDGIMSVTNSQIVFKTKNFILWFFIGLMKVVLAPVTIGGYKGGHRTGGLKAAWNVSLSDRYSHVGRHYCGLNADLT